MLKKSNGFLQAAAYGLPIVATRNGGPVDIIKVIFMAILSYYKEPTF